MMWKKGLFLMLRIYVFIITWSYFFLTQNNLIFLSSSPHSQHAIHLSWTLSITHTQIIYSTYLKTLAFESISILNYPFIMPTLSQWYYMTKKMKILTKSGKKISVQHLLKPTRTQNEYVLTLAVTMALSEGTTVWWMSETTEICFCRKKSACTFFRSSE